MVGLFQSIKLQKVSTQLVNFYPSHFSNFKKSQPQYLSPKEIVRNTQMKCTTDITKEKERKEVNFHQSSFLNRKKSLIPPWPNRALGPPHPAWPHSGAGRLRSQGPCPGVSSPNWAQLLDPRSESPATRIFSRSLGNSLTWKFKSDGGGGWQKIFTH